MIKFSIIIPVYNVEKYLSECLDSVLRQNYKNYEIILVNDGSTDSSKDICLEYAKKNDNVKYTYQENQGLSVARNTGLNLAVGDYIIFLDSDDYWSKKYFLSSLANEIEVSKSDIIVWESIKYYEDKNLFEKKQIQEKERYFYPKNELLNLFFFRSCAWDKAYSLDFFSKNDLYFEPHVIAEDVVWCAKLLAKSEKICYLPVINNVYRQRSGSITKTKYYNSSNDMYKHITDILEIIKQDDSFVNNNLKIYLGEQFANFLIRVHLSSFYNEKKTEIKGVSYLLDYGITRRTKLIKTACNCIGLSLTTRLLGFLMIRKQE